MITEPSKDSLKPEETPEEKAGKASSVAQIKITADAVFEMANLHVDLGNFFVALEKLEAAAENYFESGHKEEFIKVQIIILRMLAETAQFEKINQLKDKIHDLIAKDSLEAKSKAYYTLALCASYQNHNDVALDYLKRSLEIAIASGDKKDICFAVNGLAIVYFRLGRIPEALKEIENLEILLAVIELPEVAISTKLIHAQILSSQNQFEKSLEILWNTYELARTKKTLQMHIYLLCSLGMVYQKSGEKELARTYLNLAGKTIDRSNMIRLSQQIDLALKDLGDSTEGTFDLVLDWDNHSVLEKKMGKIDFKNQFILLDLLKLFITNQGEVYSKECLVEKVWKQAYDPSIHDNKVYVTIKRLRKLIEPDFDRPKYIFRAKNGYFINRSAKILVESRTSGGNS